MCMKYLAVFTTKGMAHREIFANSFFIDEITAAACED